MRTPAKVALLSLCIANSTLASSFNEDERDDQSIPVGGMLC